MQCSESGNQISSGDSFCRRCGTAVEGFRAKPAKQPGTGLSGLSGYKWGSASPPPAPPPAQPVTAVPARTPIVTNYAESKPTQWRSVGRWSSLAVMIAFFFPWFPVNMLGVHLLDLSGFQSAISPTINTGFGLTYLPASPILWVIVLGGLAGFGITFGSATGKTIARIMLSSGIASLLVLLLAWLSIDQGAFDMMLGFWVSLIGIGGMIYAGGTGVGQPED